MSARGIRCVCYIFDIVCVDVEEAAAKDVIPARQQDLVPVVKVNIEVGVGLNVQAK